VTMQPQDDQLLDALRVSLAPSAVRPGPAELSAFRAALASRFVGTSVTDRPAGGVPTEAAGRTGRSWSRGVRRVRHPVTALVAAAVLATGGVAAAGVATDTLPGPARQIAFAMGLPVSSPALETTRGAMGDLQRSLDRQDAAAIRTGAGAVRTDLATLAPSDRARVEPAADRLLARADAALGGSTGSGAHGTSGNPSGPATPPAGGAGAGTAPEPVPASGAGATGPSSGADTNPDGRVGSPTTPDGAYGGPGGAPSGPSGGSTATPDGSGSGGDSSDGTAGTGPSGGAAGVPGSSGAGGSDVTSGTAGTGTPGGSGPPGDSSVTSSTAGSAGASPDGGHATFGTAPGSVPR
jgi:hypothetical protein